MQVARFFKFYLVKFIRLFKICLTLFVRFFKVLLSEFVYFFLSVSVEPVQTYSYSLNLSASSVLMIRAGLPTTTA